MIYKANLEASDRKSLLYRCLLQEQESKRRFKLIVKHSRGKTSVIVKAHDNTALRAITTSMTKLVSLFNIFENGRKDR